MKNFSNILRNSALVLGFTIAAAVANHHSAVAQPRGQTAASNSSSWLIRWDDHAGYVNLVEDDGMLCGDYAVYGSYGWFSGTVANNRLTGLWDGVEDGGGGLVLNFSGNNLTGTSGDTATDTTGHTLTGTRRTMERNGNFGRRWEGHWNGETSILTLTQRGTHITGTYSGASSGTIEGTVGGNTMAGRWTDPAAHQTGRFVLRINNNGNITGASSSDRSACFGSWDMDYHP